MKYCRATQIEKELTAIREKGHPRGEFTGFRPLDEILTIKKGYPLFIAGLPHSGKTEFVMELLLNLSVFYGWKHFVYFGETGSVAEIVSELSHKLTGKTYHKGNYSMTEKERIISERFINDHFIFMDSETDFTVSEFYQFVEEAEHEHGFKFDTTTIDPFNDVKEELGEYGGREDKWLKNELKRVRISSKKNNRVDILVNHIADIKAQTDKDSGNQFTPIPLPSQWSGGRTWHRRAFTMLCIYRPPRFFKDINGNPVEENEMFIINQKAKPKGSGKLGQASLFWDWKKNRYYWTEGTQIKIAFMLNEQNEFSKLMPLIDTDALPF